MQDVTDKVACITGGASGVGFGLAQVFAAEPRRLAFEQSRPAKAAPARAAWPDI